MTIADALKDPTTGQAHVAAHTFGAAIHLWSAGKITRTQFINGADIPQHAEADVDAMKAVYDGKASAVAKLEYVLLAERCAIVLQTGDITAQQFATFMEIA